MKFQPSHISKVYNVFLLVKIYNFTQISQNIIALQLKNEEIQRIFVIVRVLWLNKEMKNGIFTTMIYDEWCNWLIIWPFLFSYTNFVSVILDIYTYFMGKFFILRSVHVLYCLGLGCCERRKWGKYFRWIPLMIYLDYFNSYKGSSSY